MPRFTLAFAILLPLAACGGGTLYLTQVTPTPSAPDAVFQCSRAALDTMRYQTISLDLNDRRVSGRHLRPDLKISDPSFYQAFDRIDVQVSPPGATGQTDLQLLGHTFYEYRTSVGPIQTEQQASDSVKATVAKLAAKCAASSM